MAELVGKPFDNPDEVREFTDGMGRVELVDLNGHAVGRGTFEPGWRWSEHVKPLAGTDSCQVEHIGYVLQGRMALRMDDGTDKRFTAAAMDCGDHARRAAAGLSVSEKARNATTQPREPNSSRQCTA